MLAGRVFASTGFGEDMIQDIGDEDCLQCNIWMPVGTPPDEGLRPTIIQNHHSGVLHQFITANYFA